MNPALSVILLTTLIGVAQGLFLALYAGEFLSTLNLLPAQDSAGFYALGSAIIVSLLAAGLASSFFHLGRPERAWRTAACWRTSWLSREVIVLPFFLGIVAVWGALHYWGWNPHLFSIGVAVPVNFTLMVGTLGVLLCLALFLCTGMIYACIKMLQEWATPLTVINYFLLGSTSGFTLAASFAAWREQPELVGYYGTWAIVLTSFAFVTRTASLVRNSRLRHKSTLQSAIGIRHARISQKSQGAMAGSFNTKEFFHGLPKRRFRLAKWVFLGLVFPIPIVLMAVGIGTQSAGTLYGAFLVQYLGLLVERWFFFAQANHPQNLYYQTV